MRTHLARFATAAIAAALPVLATAQTSPQQPAPSTTRPPAATGTTPGSTTTPGTTATPGTTMMPPGTTGSTPSGVSPPAATAPRAPAPMPQATVPAPAAGSQAAMTQQARRASRVIGANVVNEENRTVGEVHDLMISPAGGPITAVLSVGGFLGIGERYVAVPLSDLRWNAERERWMLPGATVDSLKARPAFSYPDRS